MSLILFGTTAAFYLMIYASLFQSPTIKKFFLLFLIWLVHIGAILWYGIVTSQVGFILWFFLEITMIYLVYVITGKVIRNDSLQSE
jgi:hypothetical protein